MSRGGGATFPTASTGRASPFRGRRGASSAPLIGSQGWWMSSGESSLSLLSLLLLLLLLLMLFVACSCSCCLLLFLLIVSLLPTW